MPKHQHKATQIMKTVAKTVPQKQTEKVPVTNPTERGTFELTQKEFRIIILMTTREYSWINNV